MTATQTERDLARMVPIASLTPAPWNPRTLTTKRFEQLCRSLQSDPAFLWARPVCAMANGEVYAGNQRLRAAMHIGWTEVPAIVGDVSKKLAKERSLRDNLHSGDWQDEERDALIYELQEAGSELDTLGFDDAFLDAWKDDPGAPGDGDNQVERASLADRFIVPPFSVLDARQGYWQERKRQWLALGIESEIGRGASRPHGKDTRPVTRDGDYVGGDAWPSRRRPENGLLGFSEQARSHYRDGSDGNGPARTFGQDLMRGEHIVGSTRPMAAEMQPPSGEYDYPVNALQAQSGTSIFDPVLCELAYRWFSPPDGAVLDPFAGGSVRGIVASVLGRSYTGIDLSERQIEANREQASTITPERPPTWHVGDSLRVQDIAPGSYDLLFSCPPYADLERYSDDARDISTMDYGDFLNVYGRIIAACASFLKPDRFACFVVGDVRDSKGFYHNFVSDTIRCFQDVGLRLYNEAILVTAVGSLPIRVGKQFSAGRKLGKTHQNVLVFVNGDPRKATEACGPVDVTMPDELVSGLAS